MLKLILKFFVGLILLKTVFNESCPHWSEWKKFKTEYHISFDGSNYQLSDLTELTAYIYIKIIFS
jgi:hypothetical protein